MSKFKALALFLAKNNIAHVVVAGRPVAPVFGREQYDSLRIKTNNKNQATPNWLVFLKRFNIKSVPKEISGIDAGAFRYKYHNADNTICMWTQHRPDQNPTNTGFAGKTVLRVDESSDFKFGAIRSALVKISNVQPTFKRMTKEELRSLVSQLANSINAQKDVTDIQKDLLDHDSAMEMLDDSYSDFEDLGKAYKSVRKKQ